MVPENPDDAIAARALADPPSETLHSGPCPACQAPVATLYPPDPRLCYDCQRLRAARLLSTWLGRGRPVEAMPLP